MKTQAKLAHLLLALCALILFHAPLASAADAVATVYEDFGHTIKRDAFAWGSTVYIGINQAQNDTCYRIEWIDPSGSVVASHDLQGTQDLSGNSDRFDSFFIPLGGPSGSWTARMSAFSSGNFNCTGTPTVTGTITFDVARAVIIGAGTTGADPSTTSGGGDNDVFVDQPNAVQGGGTAKKFEVWAGSGNFKRAFVRFDHTGSGISGTVTDAKLRLLMTNAPSSDRTYNAHRITGAWAETSITWNTQPAVAVSATDSLNTGAGTPSYTLVRWTVTADENGFVNNSFNNNGWRISDSAEDGAQVLRGSFGSTEANSSADKTQGPVLLVDYNDLSISCPGNLNPQCASQIPAAATTKAGFLAQGGTIAGGCGDPVMVSSSDAISNQTCANRYTITRTYTVTDACGFSLTCDQTITVNDTMAPVITVAGQAAIEATCYQTAAAAQSAIQLASSADDNCDGSRPTTVNDGVAVDSCHVKFTVSASDTCGNSTSSDVTVKVDGQAPQITIGTLAGCYQTSAAAKAAVEAASSANDNCDGSRPTTVNDGVAVDSCHVKFTVSASDTCGNSTSSDVTVKVDGQAPQITIGTLAGCYQTSAAAKAAVEAASSANDNCDGSRPTTVNDGVAADSCHVKFTVTASDTCGNSTSSDVTVKVDGQAPQITIGTLAGCYQTSAAAKAAVEAASSANDNCDGSRPTTVNDGVAVDSCHVKFTVSASDTCGNSTSSDVTVKVDGQAPQITIGTLAGCYQTSAAAKAAVEAASSANDNCDGSRPTTVNDGVAVDSCHVKFTVSASDTCGNSTSSDVTVKVDGTAPVITCPVDKVLTCGDLTTTNVTGVATAADDCDSDPQITYTDLVLGACPTGMTITRTWTAMDACGNSASCDQIITVTNTHGPTITCPANANIDCTASTLPANTGTATATDGCSGVASVTYSDVNAPGTCVGNYTITRTWKATDNCGNFSTCTQTITVTDTTAPHIACPDDIVISTGGACNAVELPDLGTPTVSDDCSGVTVSKTRSDSMSFEDPYPIGTTTITWTATDACGNSGSCNQKVTVTTDKFIASDFNGTPIAAGRTIWFDSNAKVKLNGNCPATIRFSQQTIQSAKFNVAIPDSEIHFVEGACPATTIFDGVKWVTTVGCDFTGPVFLSGYAFQVPAAGLPGGIKPVTWSGTFTTDTPGVNLRWSWGAAVYTTFAPDNNSIGVKPVDGKQCTTYLNSDRAGTPENYKPYVIGGARGNGGSNWTGSLSGAQAVAPCGQ